MGFGLLFVGYLFLLPAALSYFYTLPVSAIFLAWGCYRLRRVNLPFGWATYPAAFIGITGAFASLAAHLPALSGAQPYLEAACYLEMLIWHLAALTGLAWVAEETGLKKLRQQTVRNRIFACLYFFPAACLAAVQNIPVSEKALAWLISFRDAFLLVGVVVLVLILSSLFTAYMRICMPEDLTMPVKPSRFDFVNRRREEVRRREEEARAIAQKRIEQRKNAKNKKK